MMKVDPSFLKGLIVPVFTPFQLNDTLSLNLEIIPEYAKFLAKQKITGVLIGGTVAEGQALSLNERKALTEEWVKASKLEKLHLMVQVGGAPLPDVLELAKHAESLKVDSLLTLPEVYFRPTNGKELATYLRLVSNAAPKTPLFYYYTPRRAPVNVNIVEFMENYGNEIPTLVGLKYTFTDLAEANQLLEIKCKKIIVTFVNEELTYLACALGAESFMLPMSSLLTKLCLSIPEAWKFKDLEKAQNNQQLLTKAFHIFKKYGHGPHGVKLAMNHLTPFNFGDSRIPWNRFSSEDELKMMKELKAEVLDKLESLNLK
ncbi:N-acetylneuraminate lyase-like [Leptopilina boulardi]|uniref:N-acetylneuraminate lyase-like n=1 Tax=Leptopilina boulardi TaxID=63433 RepID=UPI0021F56DB2|nr:N-acetylneuraminate lyase-like [Leptopilina boulardi]